MMWISLGSNFVSQGVVILPSCLFHIGNTQREQDLLNLPPPFLDKLWSFRWPKNLSWAEVVFFESWGSQSFPTQNVAGLNYFNCKLHRVFFFLEGLSCLIISIMFGIVYFISIFGLRFHARRKGKAQSVACWPAAPLSQCHATTRRWRLKLRHEGASFVSHLCCKTHSESIFFNFFFWFSLIHFVIFCASSIINLC